MKTTAKRLEVPQNIQVKGSKQASVNSILQTYKDTTIQRQPVEEEELLQAKLETIQKMDLEEEEPIQGKFEATQLQSIEEEELLQGKFNTAQLQTEDEVSLQKKANHTGLPNNLKSGVENLSGYNMDDVKVHYNSAKPATLQAHAYAQGTDIHIAPGQERHLPHEAWHVVQQKQGRVKPTMQLKGTVPVNDDAGLEKEADVMGARAIQMKVINITEMASPAQLQQGIFQLKGLIQRMVDNNLEPNTQVFVKRSTSREFHGAPATIKGKGPLPNEYVIEVNGQLLIARCDQLVSDRQKLGSVSVIEADMDTVCRTPPEALLEQVEKYVHEKIKPKKPFVVGGSFAVLLHAFASGVSARTPRDIDIILDASDFGTGSKPIKTDAKIWGIPIELHKNGVLVQTDSTEQEAGFVNKDKLLAKELIKLIDQNYQFKEAFFDMLDDDRNDTAQDVLLAIEQKNDEIMSGGSESMSNESKMIWMKTIVDIRTLVQSGATLAAYKTDPWNDDW